MAKVIALVKRTRRYGDDILYARFVVNQMMNNPLFDSPPIPLVDLAAEIERLQAAEANTLTRTAGAAAARTALFIVTWGRLERLRCYVQTLADQSSDSAAAIVESAGMDIKKSSGHGRGPFRGRQGPSSGTASLLTERKKGEASYEWQFSTDAVTWQTGAWTVKASALITGLEPGKRCYFRYRPVTQAGLGDWSQVISFIVL
jgi:hypothetical protein